MTKAKSEEGIDCSGIFSLLPHIAERRAKRDQEIEDAVKKVNLGYDFFYAIDATRSSSGYAEMQPPICPKEHMRALTAAREKLRWSMTYQSRPAKILAFNI